MKTQFTTPKMAIAGLCIALYIVVMVCTQSFAFGQYQIRIATALYSLSAIFPFLILPFGIANVISNTVMGGLGVLDIVGGFIVGILTTAIIAYGKRKGCGNWIIWLAITFVPGLCVPMWLSMLLNLPYWLLASSILVGQCISGFAGMLLVTALERIGIGKVILAGGNSK